MKKKIFSVLFALVLVLTLGLVTAVPVAAEPDVTNVSVVVSPAVANSEAQYTITFTVNVGLYEPGNVIRITFPDDTVVPATIATALVTVADLTDADVATAAVTVEVDGQMVKIWVPINIEFEHVAQVVFAGPPNGAGIVNATAPGSHCLQVNTDEEPNWVDGCYNLYETVPIDVYLKYQIPPIDCGYVVERLVSSFLTINEAVDFVDELYQSGTTAVFELEGAVTTNTYYPPGGPIGDGLDVEDITFTEDEVFSVVYNTNTGSSASKELTFTPGPTATWSGGPPTGVVNVVSVVGSDSGANWGATPGYQNTFSLTGDTPANDYGDFGITADAWTDGSSIGEAVTLDVTSNPTTNPETYTVTYCTDDATGNHIASLTILTNGTPVWSPAGLPSNVVDIYSVNPAMPAWNWESECPDPGGLIGARVEVGNGTYFETFTIRTPGVMVESENGAASTIIDATGLDPAGVPATHHIAAVMIVAEGVTFGNPGHGFTVKNAGVGVDAGVIGGEATLWADENNDGIADVSGVYVWPNGGASPMRADVGHDAWCRVNVIGNIIYGSQGTGIRADAGIGTYSLPGVSVYVGECTVYDNLFDGFHGDDLCCGPLWLDPGYTFTTQHGDNEWGNTAIVGNDFYHNGGSGMGDPYKGGWTDAGIEIGSTFDFPYGLKTCYIVHNNIHDNTHAGIHLLDYAADDTLVIKFNQIVNNGVFGISTKADNPLNIACVYNNISGNPDWGIKNWEPQEGGYHPGSMLVAKLNWWGDKSGPSDGIAPLHPSEDDPDQTAEPPALGVGDAVSHFVIYQWWLTYPFEDVQEDLIRYYGSDRGISPWDLWTEIVKLKMGWNTMSTPVPLDERADEMGEICALGGWMQNYIIAYSYDALSGWNLVLGDFQLLPLEAIYIRMSGPDYLPILLRNTDWMPARDLEPGWNLVSLNVGFHDQNIQSQDVATTLNSISGSWSNAISPSMPGQQSTWVITPPGASGKYMYIGDGYWVFITKPTTLAGSRMAPWYLEQWEMDILNCGLPEWMLRQ